MISLYPVGVSAARMKYQLLGGPAGADLVAAAAVRQGVQAPRGCGLSSWSQWGFSAAAGAGGGPERQPLCLGGCVSPKPATGGTGASDVSEELSTSSWSGTTKHLPG